MFPGVWLFPFLLLLLPSLCQTVNSTSVVSPIIFIAPASLASSTVLPSTESSSPAVSDPETGRVINDDVMRKMNVKVEHVPGHDDSNYRERLFASVYVIRQMKITLGAISKPENYNEKCQPVDSQPQFTQPLVCHCSYGYGGPFCSEQKNSKRWLAWLWWPVVLVEIVLLILALARFWKRWSLLPVITTRRFVEFLMSNELNQRL